MERQEGTKVDFALLNASSKAMLGWNLHQFQPTLAQWAPGSPREPGSLELSDGTEFVFTRAVCCWEFLIYTAIGGRRSSEFFLGHKLQLVMKFAHY